MNVPLLFPCAARVKVPQLGSEDSYLKFTKKQRQEQAAINFPLINWQYRPSSRDHLNLLAHNMTFSEDVVRDRCFHMLPYDEKYMYEIFDATGLVPYPPMTKYPVGRHNARGPDIRHMPCALKKKETKLKPLKKKIMEKALKMHMEAASESEMEPEKITSKDVVTDEKPSGEPIEGKESGSSVFLTEVKPGSESVQKVPDKIKEKHEWDAYLMSLISSTTANHLVHEKMLTHEGEEKEKLTTLLEEWYGVPEHTELICDDMSDGENDREAEVEKAKPKRKWTKKETTVLAKVLQLDESKHSCDPYSDDNTAPFYRQPAGLRRVKKHLEKEEAVLQSTASGAINATAHDIQVKNYKPSPPPTLRDFVNPNVGEKLFDTDNMFEQEWLAGTHQIHQQTGDQSKIVMTSQNKYKKRLQEEFPEKAEKWYSDSEDETVEPAKVKILEKGLRRWQDLPQPIDDTAEILKVVPPGFDLELHRAPDFDTRKRVKNNAALMQIVNDWRSKWHLTGQYEDSNPDDLIRDMADIQSHVRLKAVATIGKAAEYHPPVDPGIQLEYQAKLNDPISQIPERLFVALECMLEDSCDNVRKAAAITLFSLNRVSDQASDILREALESEVQIDRWAAAQCLAHFGISDSKVIGEIIEQLLTTEDSIKNECATVLLANLSIGTNLVHCMVAEQLNSSSWRHKVMACKVLPTLDGTINKDVTSKLSDIMWNDWHEEVRKAAAQCLGKTGHGRDVHDDLKERLSHGSERLRLDALSKIGHLGIMTAKLLPAFLNCFDDEYISIRSEASISSGNLQIKDKMVIAKLIHLATFDPMWKVKALAIQALGKAGVASEQIQDCLLWAVRYEEKPGVRAEACHSLIELDMKNEEVADVLQDRFLVESSQLVRDELGRALSAMFDISATEDMDMVAQVKGEVRKLCKCNIIASQIVLNEMDEEKKQNMARLMYESEQEVKEKELHKESIMQRIRSFSHSGSQISTPKPAKHIVSSSSSSPAPSREGTMFTPTADDELEAILSVDVSSGRESPDTSSVVGVKSGAGTRTPSIVSSVDEVSDAESVQTRSRMDKIKEVEDETMSQQSLSIAGVEDELEELEAEELIQDVKDSGKDLGRIIEAGMPSTVKFSSQLMIAEVPGRSSSLMPVTSGTDVKSPMVSSMGFSAEMRAMFSREALLEREKVNMDAKNSFFGLDMRYKDMADELFQLDNSYLVNREAIRTPDQIGEIVQNVTVVSGTGLGIYISNYDESFPIDCDDLENKNGKISELSDIAKPNEVKVEETDVGVTDQTCEAVASSCEQHDIQHANIPVIVVATPTDPGSLATDEEQGVAAGAIVEKVEESMAQDGVVRETDYWYSKEQAPVEIVITTGSDSDTSHSSSDDSRRDMMSDQC